MFTSNFAALVQTGIAALFVLAPSIVLAQSQPLEKGIFTDHQDVGTVLHPGSAIYDTTTRSYTLSGSGENMWFGIDDFHFAWKKVSGDVALTADIAFLGTGGNPHRKAVLMIRQSLDGNSPAIDVAVHGSGLTSLQYRDAPGVDTHEVEANATAPKTVRIEKRGDYFYAFVSGSDAKLHPAGASTRLALKGDFYIGIGVCAHDKNAVEKAVFSSVYLEQLTPPTGKLALVSSLETISVASTDRHVEYAAPAHFEAPNWSRDGKFLIFNQDGTLRRFAFDGSQPSEIPTRSIATTTTASRPTDNSSPSAIKPPTTTNPASTSFPSPVELPGSSPPTRPPTGTAGRPTAKPLPSPGSAATTSTSTPSPSRAETKPDSPAPPASTTAPSILRTAPTSTSTPSARATCRSGA